jgi:hypothetical protein
LYLSRKTRRTLLVALVAVDVAALAIPTLDATARRSARDASSSARRELAALLGAPDLALSSSSRWLRHPSLSEPMAPFADGPATLDVDPGGGFVSPLSALVGDPH